VPDCSYISADRGPASSGGASRTQTVQVTRLDGGTYEAHVKFAEAVENGKRGLASELLATLLAGLINANVPPAEVVELQPGQVVTLRDGLNPAAGLAVAMQTIEPWVDVNAPDAILDISADALALISAVQSWTEVGDRGHNMIRSRDQVYSVDFASAFGAAWAGGTNAPSLVEDLLLRDRLASVPHAMKAAADALDFVGDDAIDQAVEKVPEDWMNAGQKTMFCARLKTTRHSVAEQIRAKYPEP
jgi:hypothetical protein